MSQLWPRAVQGIWSAAGFRVFVMCLHITCSRAVCHIHVMTFMRWLIERTCHNFANDDAPALLRCSCHPTPLGMGGSSLRSAFRHDHVWPGGAGGAGTRCRGDAPCGRAGSGNVSGCAWCTARRQLRMHAHVECSRGVDLAVRGAGRRHAAFPAACQPAGRSAACGRVAANYFSSSHRR